MREHVRLLALIGSPRRGGNTELLVQQVLRGAAERGVAAETVWLHERQIQPIPYCRPCLERGSCLLSDDFEEVMARFAAADAVVMGTPLYWYGPSAQMKAFIDRWSCKLYMSTRTTGSQEHFRSQLRGKKIVGVCAHEEPGPYVVEHLWGMLQWSCNYLDMLFWDRVDGIGNRRGEVAGDTKAMQRALELGRRLGEALA